MYITFAQTLDVYCVIQFFQPSKCKCLHFLGYVYIISFFTPNCNKIGKKLYKAKILIKEGLQLLNNAILLYSAVAAAKS